MSKSKIKSQNIILILSFFLPITLISCAMSNVKNDNQKVNINQSQFNFIEYSDTQKLKNDLLKLFPVGDGVQNIKIFVKNSVKGRYVEYESKDSYDFIYTQSTGFGWFWRVSVLKDNSGCIKDIVVKKKLSMMMRNFNDI